MGAELKDEWSFKDIGVLPGATIRIGEKEEKRPRLYVNCSFNNDRVRGEISSSSLTLTLTFYSFFILVDAKHSRNEMKHMPTSKLLRSKRLLENVQENQDFIILIITRQCYKKYFWTNCQNLSQKICRNESRYPIS